MSNKSSNSTLFVLSFIMLVNALAYGTIIPLLYPYAARFGINAVGLSLLFVSFSVAQFIATPILGRLSDRYGRKPVLLFCLLGTSLSLALFAGATNVVMLFIARTIDGITGGNISVAQAVIADSTKGEERGKAFAMLGASFGVGFLIGPALGGILSQFGLATPFWFASGLALIGTILGQIILKETLPPSKRKVSKEPLFHLKTLWEALFTPFTGLILAIGFLAAMSQNAFFIGIQSFTVDKLKMTTTQIGLMFTAFGLLNILTQAIGLRLLLNKFKNKNAIVTVSLLVSTVVLAAVYFTTSVLSFIPMILLYGLLISPVVPLQVALLSERTKGEDQGGMLGINQSYTSIGQIIGPLFAGFVAAKISVPAIFFLSAGFLAIGLIASRWLHTDHHNKFDL